MPAVPLDHIKSINKQLYKNIKEKVTKIHADLFAKTEFHRRIIPGYEFRIDLIDEATNETIFKPQYPLNEEKRLVYIHHAQNNVKTGMFIPNNTSQHNVPAIVIEKKDGRRRLAYDFTLLNAKTKTVQSHIPAYEYIFEKLRGKGKFTVTDLKNFFECIKLRFKDQDLCHVTTPIGEFNITCGTYGFKNISAIAQDIANKIVKRLRNAGAFIDDIFIKHAPDATPQELEQDVDQLFEGIRETNVLLHPRKTYFFVDEIEYLGYIFNQNGTKPQPKYIKKILKFKRPLSKNEIRSYLGVLQYIGRYLYKLADWSHDLNIIANTKSKQHWGKAQDLAFDTLQQQVANIKLLAHPTEDGTFLIQTDASEFAISGVLYQRQYSTQHSRYIWKLIEFYSKQIDQALRPHPIMVKECLAIAYAANHWQHFLLRKLFYMDTDHKNLIQLFDEDENKASNMKRKQIFITLQHAISQFHFKIAHIAGTKIPFADYLSRDGNQHNNLQLNLIQPQYQSDFDKINHYRVIDQMNYLRKLDFNCEFTDYDTFVPTLHSYHHLLYNNHKLFTIQSNQFKYNINKSFINSHYFQPAISMIQWLPESFTKPSKLHDPIQALQHKPTKSCIKRSKPITQATYKDTHTIMASYNDHNIFEIDKIINNRLKEAEINMLNNTNTITSTTIYQVCRIFTMTNMIDPEQLEYNKPQSIFKIEEPNYNTDIEGRRRSKRVQNKSQTQQAQEFYDDNSSSDSDESDEKDNTQQRQKPQHNSNPNHSEMNKLLVETMQQIQNPEIMKSILNPDNMRQSQHNDPICMNIIHSIKHPTFKSTRLAKYFKFVMKLLNRNQFYLNSNQLLCIKPDKHHPQARLVIPQSLIKHILQHTHKSVHRNHPGQHATQKQIELRFWWYQYATDVTNYVKECNECQLGKGTKSKKLGKLAPLNASQHGELVHFDFAGPFHKSLNILVMVDNYTGVSMFIPTNTQTANEVIRCLIQKWMPIHGMPRNLVTDRGKGFIDALNQEIYTIFGIHKLFTSRYHPQTNATAERMVQELKKQYRLLNITLDNGITNDKTPAAKAAAIRRIKLLLPSIQFALNQRIRSFCDASPHQLLYGRNLNEIEDVALQIQELTKLRQSTTKKSKLQLINELNDHLNVLRNNFNKNHAKYVIIMKRKFDMDKKDHSYEIGQLVAYYVGDRANKSRKLQRRFTGPWQITEMLRHNTVKLLNRDTGATMACHVQMLKPYNKEEFTPLSSYTQSQIQKQKIENKQKKEKRERNKLKQNNNNKQDKSTQS